MSTKKEGLIYPDSPHSLQSVIGFFLNPSLSQVQNKSEKVTRQILDAHASQAPGLSLSQSLSQSVSHKDRIFTNLTILLLAISQTYLRYFSTKSQPNLSQISANLSQISAVSQPYLSLILGVCQAYPSRNSAVSQPIFSQISVVSQPVLSRISAISQPYPSCISGISRAYVR